MHMQGGARHDELVGAYFTRAEQGPVLGAAEAPQDG